MALMAYIAIACAVWLVAVVLAFPRRTRDLAKRIAAGMAGSFPGVFLFQLLSVPLFALYFLLIWCIAWLIPPRDGSITSDSLIVTLIFISFGIMAIMSLLGFYTGWRVAWELAAGRSARAFLVADRVLGPAVRFLRKRLPFLERVL
jgi:hypothetical protein